MKQFFKFKSTQGFTSQFKTFNFSISNFPISQGGILPMQ